MDEQLKQAWLRFLHGFALADHIGDASGDVRAFAKVMGLPQPPDDASLDEWCEWVKAEHGIDESLHAMLLRQREGGTLRPAPLTLQQRLDLFLQSRGY
jgi:hypothetical protein